MFTYFSFVDPCLSYMTFVCYRVTGHPTYVLYVVNRTVTRSYTSPPGEDALLHVVLPPTPYAACSHITVISLCPACGLHIGSIIRSLLRLSRPEADPEGPYISVDEPPDGGMIAIPRIAAPGDKAAWRGFPEGAARPALSRRHPPWSATGSVSVSWICLARFLPAAPAVCWDVTLKPAPGELFPDKLQGRNLPSLLRGPWAQKRVH